MAKYIKNLPQLNDKFFLTDGGLESALVYLHHLNLPHFAAFNMLKDAEGIGILRNYYNTYIEIAKENRLGFIMESATWRANPDWAAKLGYSPVSLDEANRTAIRMLTKLRKENEDIQLVISGCVGPRFYENASITRMNSYESEIYHRRQIQIFDIEGADMITAISMTNSEEAIGIVKAAKDFELPVSVSFKIEEDGKLTGGEDLKSAIEKVDNQTFMGPSYYMINCDHPTHFMKIITRGQSWPYRISGIRANVIKSAGTSSENQLSIIDNTHSKAAFRHYKQVFALLPNLRVIGTDYQHIKEIARICRSFELPSVY